MDFVAYAAIIAGFAGFVGIGVLASWNAYQCIFVLPGLKERKNALMQKQIAMQEEIIQNMRDDLARYRPVLTK